MKTKRKILFFVALLCLFYCLSIMQGTYAKYVSSSTANADFTIARWNILVNDQDVLYDSNFTNTISPQFAGTTNIKNGVIAPTAQGTFSVNIDGTNTDVSFEYTLNVALSDDNTVDDLRITRYTLNGVNHTFTDQNPFNGVITNDILLNDRTRTSFITFYVEWNDNSSTETMDNADDTAAAYDGVAAFDVELNVIQIE